MNTVLPARAGDALRIGLFSKRLRRRNRVWATGGAFAAIGVARAAWTAVLVLAAFSTGALPLWPALALGGAAIAAIVVVFALRHRTGDRLRGTLEALETLRRSPRRAAKLVAWIGGSTVARVGAAAAVAAAMGIHSPLVAALLIVPALDVAGVLPLTPGNLGVASGAVAVALSGHGVDGTTALSTGILFHALETLTSLAVGTRACSPWRRCRGSSGGSRRMRASAPAPAWRRASALSCSTWFESCRRRSPAGAAGEPARARGRAIRRSSGRRRIAARLARPARAATSPRTSTSARVFLEHGFTLWNNFWYAGRYSFVTYSLLYYPLAALLGIRLLAVATRRDGGARVRGRARAGMGPGGALVEPDRSRSSGPGIVLSAAFPFALGVALALLALWALQAGRRWRFALLAAARRSRRARSPSSCSPSSLGGIGLARTLAAAAALVPGARARRRRGARARALAALPRRRALPVLARRARGRAAFLRLGAALTWRVERAGVLRWIFVVYLAACSASTSFRPRSARTSRGCASRRSRSRCSSLSLRRWRPLPRRASSRSALAVAWNLTPLAGELRARRARDPAATPAYWAPAIALPARAPDALLPRRGGRHGRPLARGLPARGRDPARARLVPPGRLPAEQRCSTASSAARRTSRWLRSLGVRYVVLTDAPLDYSARGEARAAAQRARSGLPVVLRSRTRRSTPCRSRVRS